MASDLGQKGKLSGLIGVVTTLIEAKREHEMAIEVALGGQAQDIVVETADEGKSAIRWLKESRVGRATFLPLDLIEGRENNHNLQKVLGEKGVIGFATDLVKFEPRLKNVVQHLLGNVVVVENLDVAVALQRRGIRTRYVTLEGEMVANSGAMTGGSMKVAGLLNRTREVKELATKLKQLRANEKQLNEKVALLKTEVVSLKEQSETLGRQAQAQEIEAARARKDFEAIDHRANEKGQQLASIDQRRAGMEKEISGHRLKQQEGGGELAELTRQVEELEAELLKIEDSATSRQQEVAEAGRLANEVMLNLTAGTERARSLKERMESSHAEAERLKAAAEGRRNEIANLEAELGEAGAEMKHLEEQLTGYQAQKKELDGQITFENEQKEVVQLDLRKLGERSQVLQRDFNIAQNELHETELKRTEFLLQLDNIKVQSKEKFSLGLNDVITRVLMPELISEENEARALKEAEDKAKAEQAVQDDNDEESDDADEDREQDEFKLVEAPEPEAEIIDISELSDDARERLDNLHTPEEIAGLVQNIQVGS